MESGHADLHALYIAANEDHHWLSAPKAVDQAAPTQRQGLTTFLPAFSRILEDLARHDHPEIQPGILTRPASRLEVNAMAAHPYTSAGDPDSRWTSDTRDDKLKTLLQGKQGDAENAKILIDLLENGVLGADSSGDSDSDDDEVPLYSSTGPPKDGMDFPATLPAGLADMGLRDRIFIEYPNARERVHYSENGERVVEALISAPRFTQDDGDEDAVLGPIWTEWSTERGKKTRRVGAAAPEYLNLESPAPPASQLEPPATVYELVEAPQVRLERVADVHTETSSASVGVAVEGRASVLEENESEVRELEKQLREKKARLEEMRRERAASGVEADHRRHLGQSTGTVEAEMAAWATAAAPEAADKRAWFSRAKSSFRRLFSRTGAEGTEKAPDRDLPNPQNKPSREQKPSPDGEPAGQHDINTLFVVNDNLPLPNGTQDTAPAAKKPTPLLPPPKVSDSETLLRTKIFAPHTLALMTALPEPVWTSPADPATATTLFSLTAAPLTRHTLLPQGQFVAQRQRDVTDALSKIELGLGATLPGGVGVNATSTGLLGLLKPYQWINMWRGVEREMYVASHNKSSDSDEKGEADVDMDALHALENELMSPAKYLFGETEYLTVVTHSSDVNSGAVSLFRASLGRSGLVTALTLKARFKDMPREICRILRRGVKPNRYELRRSGRALSCRERGGEGVLPPCLAVVRRDGEAQDGEGVEEGWASIGGGWRRALRIVLGEGDAGTGPREGLVATVPQMLAFLHLTHRVVDYVPSTPVFSFEPPLTGMADDGACRVRRGTKLLGQPGGAVHVGESVTISVLFSRESRWVREQLLWA